MKKFDYRDIFQAPHIPIENYDLQQSDREHLPKTVALEYQALPMEKVNNLLIVGMVNPSKELRLGLEKALGVHISAFKICEEAFLNIVHKFYK